MSDYKTLRKSPRRQFERTVSILHKGTYYLTESRQISEGGMMILSPIDLNNGDRIVVNFMIPGAGALILQAEVLYRIEQEVGYRYGIKFTVPKFEAKRWIRSYIAAKTEQEAIRDGSTVASFSRRSQIAAQQFALNNEGRDSIKKAV